MPYRIRDKFGDNQRRISDHLRGDTERSEKYR